MKISFFLFLFFSATFLFGQDQTGYRNEIGKNKFVHVSKRRVPLSFWEEEHITSHHQLGSRMTQTGCTSGKRLVIIWAVTDKHGLYVMRTATCGRCSNTHYYVFSGGKRMEVYMPDKVPDFETFKQSYLNRP